RGGDGSRGARWGGARTRPGRARGTRDGPGRRRHDQRAAPPQLAHRARGGGDARIWGSRRARPRPRRRVAPGRTARGVGDQRRSRPRLVGSSAARGSSCRSRRSACAPARRCRGRGRPRRRRGGHVAPRGHGAQSEMVRRGARRWTAGGRVAPLKGALGRALLRLFAVQGSYNYERMLGVGVGVAEEPLLRDLADGKYRPAVARGAHFFNSHPYLTGHVALRWWALNAGWTYGARVSVALHSPMLQKALALLGPAMAFAVGFALPLAARFLAVPFPRWGQLAAVVTAGLVFLALRWRSD